MNKKSTADRILQSGAETYAQRNALYKDNFYNVGKVMKALFPDGLHIKEAEDWTRLQLFIQNIVKQSRYAVNWDAGGHADSSHDSMVYMAMLSAVDENVRSLDSSKKEQEAKPQLIGRAIEENRRAVGEAHGVTAPPIAAPEGKPKEEANKSWPKPPAMFSKVGVAEEEIPF